jgi:hypothetical protein
MQGSRLGYKGDFFWDCETVIVVQARLFKEINGFVILF